ncbi:MAG: phosphonate ABC transporter, permease protein PhnE [Chloroflexota bacterium]
MTAAPLSRRPTKPARSPVLLLGLLAFLALTYLSLSGQFGIGLDIGRLIDDFGRVTTVLWRDNPNPARQGLLQPNWAYVPQTVGPMIETFQMAVIAAVIGCGVALPISFLASRLTTAGRITLFVTRSVLNVVRAIPDILYALVFVAAVGIGPLPGILALILFNVGVVAKLLSETVDGVDQGPIEAARAAGGNQTQTVRWAVLPQVLPNYVAYSLYTFELNIRASTVLGIVGAGGIGRALFAQYKLFNWSNVAVTIVELFLLVLLIETVSIWLRRRLV